MNDRVGKLEVAMGSLTTRVESLEGWNDEESRPFHKDMRDFKSTLLAEQKKQREVDDARHSSNTFKLNLIGIIVAIATLIIAGVGAVIGYEEFAHHANVLLPKISVQSPADPAYADGKQQQDSGLPSSYVPQ